MDKLFFEYSQKYSSREVATTQRTMHLTVITFELILQVWICSEEDGAKLYIAEIMKSVVIMIN